MRSTRRPIGRIAFIIIAISIMAGGLSGLYWSSTAACLTLPTAAVILIALWWRFSWRPAIRNAEDWRRPECSNCGYNLMGTPGGRCPECGHKNTGIREKLISLGLLHRDSDRTR